MTTEQTESKRAAEQILQEAISKIRELGWLVNIGVDIRPSGWTNCTPYWFWRGERTQTVVSEKGR